MNSVFEFDIPEIFVYKSMEKIHKNLNCYIKFKQVEEVTKCTSIKDSFSVISGFYPALKGTDDIRAIVDECVKGWNDMLLLQEFEYALEEVVACIRNRNSSSPIVPFLDANGKPLRSDAVFAVSSREVRAQVFIDAGRRLNSISSIGVYTTGIENSYIIGLTTVQELCVYLHNCSLITEGSLNIV
ncbi:MAG: hypothetical protein NTY56_02535 [Patescibacteria group bacterium]|nr:hypothetical protein [Patescibacteria group bacterium]